MNNFARTGFTRTVRQAKGPGRVKIGMRAEDAQRIWERRAPLTPQAVYQLTSSGRATVEVVSSSKRIFHDMEYRKAGAEIVPSLTDPDIVLGIKEPPIYEVQNIVRSYGASLRNLSSSFSTFRKSPSSQTHLMFSHTAKGQPYNTGLLSQFAAKSTSISIGHPRLVDYELLTDEATGQRAVGFGWFAGVAGVLESLSSMAHSHLELGIASPFVYTPRPHTYPSLTKLREAMKHIGSVIATQGTPSELGPFVIGLTGRGKVAQGCLDMLSELPIEKVKVADLDSLMSRWKSADVDLRKIYLVHALPEDYLVRLDGGQYSRDHYYQSPQSYESVFCDKVAPYLTLFLNGAGWSPSFPRLMTNDQLAIALMRAKTFGGARFTNIGDITCDIEGGLQFLDRATTLSSPFYKFRPSNLPADLPSVQMMSVDILPASLPHDASHHFSSSLERYIDELVEYYNTAFYMAPSQSLLVKGRPTLFPLDLERATIASGGRLVERHAWLQGAVDRYSTDNRDRDADVEAFASFASRNEISEVSEKESPAAAAVSGADTDVDVNKSWSGRKKRVLMLGSGMVAGPAVDLIARNPAIELIVASDSSVELQRLVEPHLNVKFRIIDADNMDTYNSLIEETDVVISLLPAVLHVAIAKQCIKYKKDLVTASYISHEMQSLHNAAIDSDVLLLNEIGLDPGIDHCSAMDLITRLKAQRKHIVSFTSFCGGLPVPEDAHVPLGYKFSWRPQGVLTAALNEALYLLTKQVVKVPGDKLLQSYFPNIPITNEFQLEGLPNRNSTEYILRYKLGSYVRTFVRGTLRYPSFSSLMNSFRSLGLLNNQHLIELTNWDNLVMQALTPTLQGRKGTLELSSIIPIDDVEPLQDALDWLGLTNLEIGGKTMPPIPKGRHTPLDLFAMAPMSGDMVVLSHEVITTGKVPGYDGYKSEVHTSTLITKGTLEHNVGYEGERPASAMARTVGIPVAIAAMLVAQGKLQGFKGVVRPIYKDIYKPILEGLEEVGLRMVEKSSVGLEGKKTVELALMTAQIGEEAHYQPHHYDPPARDLDSDKGWDDEKGVIVS
ncbi:Saccharopine dehydrogenase-domain-containing protein [Gymnopilus junonius]|uniref:Saccharopine dehydrogenase-domain-containing protein n=1 Tax=Gymnopilus junonius TaxID=109634 RepID=A0A9P5TKE4_GYMJU|nr:Saccharopine dehydrogenase-domain-containing protein [Gymnopilus junonius]